MPGITVGAPRSFTERGWPAVAAPIKVGDQHIELYFRASRGPLSLSIAPFVLSMLLPAMKLGMSLNAAAPLSPEFIAAQERLQRLFLAPFQWLQHATVGPLADQRPALSATSQPDQRGVFLFFSGGVDSFYTLLQHREEITHCVFVHGFDTLLENVDVRARNVRAMRQAAAELGKPLIEIETNYRSCVDRFERWNHHSAMVAQFAMVCALSAQFKRAYVAENYDYFGRIRPAGTEPVYSFGDAEAIQDGLDCMRIDKTTLLAGSDTAMRWLRVCWQNTQMAFNCGRCEKCVRTMIALHLGGGLARCRTFGRPLDLQRVRYLAFGDSGYFWPELLLELERHPADSKLAEAVRDSIGWATVPEWMRGRLVASLEKKGNVPELVRVFRERMEYAQTPPDAYKHARELGRAMTRVADLENELRVIKSSRSWKLTGPVRSAGRLVQRLRSRLR